MTYQIIVFRSRAVRTIRATRATLPFPGRGELAQSVNPAKLINRRTKRASRQRLLTCATSQTSDVVYCLCYEPVTSLLQERKQLSSAVESFHPSFYKFIFLIDLLRTSDFVVSRIATNSADTEQAMCHSNKRSKYWNLQTLPI
jgi:CMP-N-acetylneuraminic acid synthetase